MPRLPVLSAREVVRAFERLGLEVARHPRTHVILTKPGHLASLSVPNHAEVARGTLRALITKAAITVEQFVGALDK